MLDPSLALRLRHSDPASLHVLEPLAPRGPLASQRQSSIFSNQSSLRSLTSFPALCDNPSFALSSYTTGCAPSAPGPGLLRLDSFRSSSGTGLTVCTLFLVSSASACLLVLSNLLVGKGGGHPGLLEALRIFHKPPG